MSIRASIYECLSNLCTRSVSLNSSHSQRLDNKLHRLTFDRGVICYWSQTNQCSFIVVSGDNLLDLGSPVRVSKSNDASF
jgi:hypothetical protein